MSKPTILQFLLRHKPASWAGDALSSTDPEQNGQALYRLGRSRMRLGDACKAVDAFDQALAILPNYAEAVAARAECLDLMGASESARPEYERARRLWVEQRSGAPDRSYLYRQLGRFTFEMDSYELALERIKTGAFPYLACGNALLAQGRAAEALKCYDRALRIKPNNPDLTALRGEALSMMGRFEKAIEAFDFVLATNPKAPETLNARAIARSALGRLDEANTDWRRQMTLLSPDQSAARAYIALRLADFAAAEIELERGVPRTSRDLYWQLYRMGVQRRLGRMPEPIELPANAPWPAPLIALHAGLATAEAVLARADTPGRHAEAAFQLGVIAIDSDREAARKWWKEVVEAGVPALIEHGAARNELARLGS